MTFPSTLGTIIIENVAPELHAGRYPIKREVGDRLEVSADIFKEGHDVLAAVVRYRTLKEARWRETPMSFVDNDRWIGWCNLTENTRYLYTIAAWVDTFESWRREIIKKLQIQPDLNSELLEGLALVRAAA
ncbi:MAG: alpha-1,4-glucan--maltose-1-phosphate maltosyltransferase, partial [Nitrospiraceae bacterium]